MGRQRLVHSIALFVTTKLAILPDRARKVWPIGSSDVLIKVRLTLKGGCQR
jgi:hypothetical protein